ncbi:hypothetical protein KRR26_28535 [Corallococcus sp. M34]|uniref:hypothetical protein n=1 Tax=Citreicoccus inhibens TaxID=2849499 RepID=UPI001C23C2A5|nr:hypothetical protein [Citreicoccus inhibens]MBU8899564.1 hypothetical protein [Citreicoccus inhibens]
MSQSTTAKDVVRRVIKDVAPHEARALDAMWKDFEIAPGVPLAGAERTDHSHGMDAALTNLLVSSIVIPVVVDLLKEAGKLLVKDVVNRIRKKRGSEDAKDEELAKKIVAAIQDDE